jgi:hypothetical protein
MFPAFKALLPHPNGVYTQKRVVSKFSVLTFNSSFFLENKLIFV